MLDPVLVDLSARSSGRREKIHQKSKIGASAPRDTVVLGGSDEDTPWEGRLRWAPRKNPSQSTIGAAAPRDMLTLRGSDENTPWEGHLQWG